MADKTLTCRDCGTNFTFTEGEQDFYAQKGYSEPGRCPDCRSAKKASRDGGYGSYTSCPTHSITFDDGSNISSPTQSEGTFTRNFSTVGTFKYHCAVHGTSMSGQITVQ